MYMTAISHFIIQKD